MQFKKEVEVFCRFSDSFMRYLFYIVLLAFTVTGCSPHSGNSSADRIAAVVNGVEITQLEVRSLYERTAAPGVSKEAALEQKRNILASLVRSELLAQQAVKLHLDKTPEFPILLHEARRQVLAGMAQQSLAAATKPLEIEAVRDIVAQNPRLFAERKLLVYEEVVMPVVDVPFLQSLNVQAGKGASLDQLVDEIKAKKMQFRRVTQTQSTDQLEPAIVNVLTSSKPGVPVVARVQDKFAMVLMLHNAVPIPITGEQAEQAARTMISSQMRNMAIQKKVKDALDKAKITYLGEYAQDASGKKIGALPLPDTERAERMNFHSMILALSITGAFAFVMLQLSASVSVLLGSIWAPRFWPAPKVPAVEKNVDAWLSEYWVPAYIKFFILCCAVVSLFILGSQIMLVWPILEVWIVLASAVTGVLLGTGLSHLYARSPFPRWWVSVVLFTLLSLAAALVVTLRFAGV